MDLIEGVGESSSPPRSVVGSLTGSYDVRSDVYARLVEAGNEDDVSNPEFRDLLEAHFNRLPSRYFGYLLDVNMDRVEDVLLHQKLLIQAKEPGRRPVFHVRFLESIPAKADGNDDLQLTSTSKGPWYDEDNAAILPSENSNGDVANEFEPCSKLEDLNLDVRKISNDVHGRYPPETNSKRKDIASVPIHEVIFSTVDKPKLLSQLSALLSDIGLNIREAHVFSTTDGYSLDVFVVDGWYSEDTDGLNEAMVKAIARNKESWSGSSHSSSAVEKALAAHAKSADGEIDRRLLKIGERIGSGSCGDLHRGDYLGQDVAVKILKSEQLNDTLQDEFAQEVAILRQVQHKNIVRFIGACTKPPHFCIVTEYMPGGSLYSYLQKNRNVLKLPQLLKFAIDVCKGMDYLHKSNIIHRDLKTANLLMDNHNVVKVADFGVARFQSQGGVMTAETGTYRWMAPEVINHQPYDEKADIFSFAVVLWELITAKIPYENMTPLQAALGVRQGLRPELPENAHPKLLELMQRCWEAEPGKRPAFSEITIELEHLLQEVQEHPEVANGK
ncbi:serine/threonine-protein kinase STY46-like isoform X2 [Syzygium oleosum]|uniref:serine/threonine-protein kinase STY46-like isoform X2 n=1 Tax=Syzygium oleosum TaxID=219896 RepID=UPI0011D21B6A|nr:serine/threonine-protein kinase STY46-like isoform X2 [Syzygium oleosum]